VRRLLTPRVVRVGDGRGNVLYADEACPHATCCRPIGHKGRCDQFDGPPSPDALTPHPPDVSVEERIVDALVEARQIIEECAPGYTVWLEETAQLLRILQGDA
jgi:hypothetical protein